MIRGTWRRRRSPTALTCGLRAWAAWWPESFPAVPCRSPVRPRDRLETQASQRGDLDFGVHTSRIVRRDVLRGRRRGSVDNSPGSTKFVDPTARRQRTRRGRCGGPSRSPGALKNGLNGSDYLLEASCALLCPRRSKICGKWNFPLSRVVRNRGVPFVVHSGAFLARVVHRFRSSAPRAGHSCCASSSENRRAEGSRGRGEAWDWVSRRRGCGCAMGSISCFMRCRCGSCLRRRTGRWRCVDGGCRWCRCWTSRLAAGAWRVSPRREGRQGAAGNGLGIDVGDARGRDEQRPGSDRCVPRAAASSGRGGAQQVGAGAVDPGRSDGHR